MKELKLCDMTSGARVPVNWADAPEFVPGSGRLPVPGEDDLRAAGGGDESTGNLSVEIEMMLVSLSCDPRTRLLKHLEVIHMYSKSNMQCLSVGAQLWSYRTL